MISLTFFRKKRISTRTSIRKKEDAHNSLSQNQCPTCGLPSSFPLNRPELNLGDEKMHKLYRFYLWAFILEQVLPAFEKSCKGRSHTKFSLW